MTLSGTQVRTSLVATINTTAGPTAITMAVRDESTNSYPAASAAGSADVCYSARRTVSAGTPDNIDLTTLTDPLGAAIALVHVEAIIITNRSTTAGQDMTVGGGTNPLHASIGAFLSAGSATLPGGRMVIENRVSGFAVVNSASDIICVAVAAGTAVAYDITLLGRSA